MKAPCCAHESQVRQEGYLGQAARPKPKGRETCQTRWRARGQQERQDPGTAEAVRRRDPEGTDEGDRLAAAFGPGFSLGRGRQKDGADRQLDQERGRRAPLLGEGLIMASSGSDEQQYQFRHAGLAPYSEVVAWRRRFYAALVAALFAWVALAVICAGTH